MISDEEKRKLFEAIRAWRVGDPVPEELVAFPHHEGLFHCGLCASWQSVENYVGTIADEALLKALMLDPRTDDRAFQATIWRVLYSPSLAESSRFIDEVLAEKPALVHRGRMAEVVSQLSEQCISFRIARFDKDEPPPLDYARNVILAMQDDLNAGKGWESSYQVAADQLKNQQDIDAGETCVGTHLSYAYSGSATSDYRDVINGYDLRIYEYAKFPNGHLEALFKAMGGTHIIETPEAIWLYNVEEYYPGTGRLN